MKNRLIAFVFFLMLSAAGFTQYTPWYYWTFLPEPVMQEIIGESSGETALHTIIETAGFTRNRRPEEYRTTFRESAYIYDKLKWYGVPEAQLVRLPARQDVTWNGIRGDLWEIGPGREKIVSFRDNAFQLTMGSNSADVEADLVWVGSGSADEIEKHDLNGKIAVGHAHVGQLHTNARRAGAVGVIAISNSRNYIDPLQIPQGRISNISIPGTGETLEAGFAFQMNIREGQHLINRLLRGEQIRAHAIVETSMEPFEIQNVEATIYGEDPESVAVIFSAHIFEGVVKQGANDNKSGGAAILEVARVLNLLIEEGRIPRPKRSIRFVWGPEFLGTRPWVAMNFEDIREAYCNINMDMVGEWLTLHNAYFSLMRTTFGNAHYVNDVVENYFRFVGEGNRERIQNRREVPNVPHRIVAPFGADEPFHYSIETHYGSSDHVVFNDFGVRIPGVMMIAWPDLWYHTSGDIADKADPTQLKRTVIIGAAAAYTIANADDDMAVRIAAEVRANGARRLGHQLNVAMDMVSQSDISNLADNYKQAVNLLQAHQSAEIATLESVFELASSRDHIASHITAMQESIEAIGQANLLALKAHVQARARHMGLGSVEIMLTAEERAADAIIPVPAAGTHKGGPNLLTTRLSELPESVTTQYPIAGRIDRTEIARLVDGNRSVLMISHMINAQQAGGTELEDVINFVEHLKAVGLVTY